MVWFPVNCGLITLRRGLSVSTLSSGKSSILLLRSFATSGGDGNPDPPEKAGSIYEFTANDIDGNPVSLEKYRGNVVMVVNVASA
jgi:hypothetical protein